MTVLAEVCCESEVDVDGRFVRAGSAVLERAGDDLVGTPFCLVLADERGRVIERVDGDTSLAAQLDRVLPGCGWSEGWVGVNAVGASRVRGGGHVVEARSGMACVATPITDPRHGRPVGVVALICRDRAG